MPLPIRTAIAACSSPETIHSLALLLGESGITLEAVARNAAEAIELLKAGRPDLLIADMVLPVIDGATLAEHIMGTFCLPVRPRTLLIHYPEFTVPKRAELEALGVCLAEKPLTGESFSLAIGRLTHALPRFSERAAAFADKLLDELGFSVHTGRDLLKTAALIAAHDASMLANIRTKLLPLAAEMNSVTVSQAERAMRYAIAQAWRSDKFENQCRIFSDTVDAGRGQPTLGEMISQLADILRLEG